MACAKARNGGDAVVAMLAKTVESAPRIDCFFAWAEHVMRLLERRSVQALFCALSLAIASPAAAENPAAFGERMAKFQARGEFDKALAEAKALEAYAKAHGGTRSVLYLIALAYLGQCSSDLARYQEAEAYLRRGATLAEQKRDPMLPVLLGDLATNVRLQGRYTEAETLARRGLALSEKMSGSDSADTIRLATGLADVLHQAGKAQEAEPLFRRALAIREKTIGPNASDTAATLTGLANSLNAQGRYTEADPIYRRALAIAEKVFGPDNVGVGLPLNNLANNLDQLGLYAEAETLYRRALAYRERSLGPDHPDIGVSLTYLAALLDGQGRPQEAEPLFRRALAIREKVLGPDHPDVGQTLSNLASNLKQQGRLAEAEICYAKSLVIREKALGPEAGDVGQSLDNLARVMVDENKLEEAEPYSRRAVAVLEKALGPEHPRTALALNGFGVLLEREGKLAEAEGYYVRALAIREKALGPDHPGVLPMLNNLTRVAEAKGDLPEALDRSRKAVAAVLAASQRTSSDRASGDGGGFLQSQSFAFHNHVRLLALARDAKLEPEPALTAEAFEMMQRSGDSRASAALRRMTARFASGGDELAGLTRRLQDLQTQRDGLDHAVLAALGKASARQDARSLATLRTELSKVEAEIASLSTALQRDFPRYAELVRPEPIKAEAVQRLLDADEALLVFVTGDRETVVFAVTREALTLKTIPLDADVLASRVAAFRRGLDVNEFVSSSSDPSAWFDLALAHDVYRDLLGPVAGTIAGKQHLVVVPTGALTALPFHLLLTQPSSAKKPLRMQDYREAAWLIRRHAVSVLPSVSSLPALRDTPQGSPARKTMIGFGDPIFSEVEASSLAVSSRSPAPNATRAAYTEFWKGAGIDKARLSEALPQLPDTADELNAIAQRLGVPASDIYLRDRASERQVKQLPLADYRIVYFATHGLIAGDVKDLGEPSLVLTLPRQPSDLDDGLLTAGEVARLQLHADWVVLSACNTIAGDKPGAEALSGLVRAFFYAGARALLVTHWSAASEAATKLTTTSFDLLAADPRLGRAEALRRSMIAFMDDAAVPLNAYPAFWAPFAVIGEGGRR